MPRPPTIIKGLRKPATKPSYQENMKQIRQDNVIPKSASKKIPRLSAVRPFSRVTSYVRQVVRTPGARVLESNQATFFLMIAAKSFPRIVAVNLSLATLKQTYWIPEVSPIPRQRKKKQIVHIVLCP